MCVRERDRERMEGHFGTLYQIYFFPSHPVVDVIKEIEISSKAKNRKVICSDARTCAKLKLSIAFKIV